MGNFGRKEGLPTNKYTQKGQTDGHERHNKRKEGRMNIRKRYWELLSLHYTLPTMATQHRKRMGKKKAFAALTALFYNIGLVLESSC